MHTLVLFNETHLYQKYLFAKLIRLSLNVVILVKKIFNEKKKNPRKI